MVGCWPTFLQQLLLDDPAGPGGQRESTLVIPRAEELCDLGRSGDFSLDTGVCAGQKQIFAIAGDFDEAIATDGLANVIDDGGGNSKLRERLESANNLIGGVTGGTGVP